MTGKYVPDLRVPNCSSQNTSKNNLFQKKLLVVTIVFALHSLLPFSIYDKKMNFPTSYIKRKEGVLVKIENI
jgi:hypothetical protein